MLICDLLAWNCSNELYEWTVQITRPIPWRHISLCKPNNGLYCGGWNRHHERCGYRTWGFFNTLTSGQVVTGLHTLLQSTFLWMQMLIFHVECPWSVFFKHCLKIVLLQLALIIWDFSMICIYLSFLCHYIVPMQTCLIRRITKLRVIHAHMDRDKAVLNIEGWHNSRIVASSFHFYYVSGVIIKVRTFAWTWIVVHVFDRNTNRGTTHRTAMSRYNTDSIARYFISMA